LATEVTRHNAPKPKVMKETSERRCPLRANPRTSGRKAGWKNFKGGTQPKRALEFMQQKGRRL